MYELGQYIIYGNNGVCLIQEIGPAPLPELNQERTYYTLMPLSEKVQIYAPIDTRVFMRPILSVDEVHALILKIPSLKANIISTSNSTELAGEYRKLLSTQEPLDLLRLIKSIRKKNQKAEKENRRIGLTDSRFLKQAEDLIYGEFSISLSIEKEKVDDYIKEYLKKNKKLEEETKIPEDSEEDEENTLLTEDAKEPAATQEESKTSNSKTEKKTKAGKKTKTSSSKTEKTSKERKKSSRS